MTCPKCGSTALIRDDDPSNWMEVVACFICGWRLYREVPDRGMKVRDISGNYIRGLTLAKRKKSLSTLQSQKR